MDLYVLGTWVISEKLEVPAIYRENFERPNLTDREHVPSFHNTHLYILSVPQIFSAMDECFSPKHSSTSRIVIFAVEVNYSVISRLTSQRLTWDALRRLETPSIVHAWNTTYDEHPSKGEPCLT